MNRLLGAACLAKSIRPTCPSLVALPTNQQSSYSTLRERNKKRYIVKKRLEKLKDNKTGPFASEPTVNNTFIKQRLYAYKPNGRWKQAFLMYQKLAERDAYPDRSNFHNFLHLIGQLGGAVPQAFQIFRHGVEKYENDRQAYNIMISTCAKHPVSMNDDREDYLPTNSLKKVLELYEEMKENDMAPNASTYSAMLQTFYLHNRRLNKESGSENPPTDLKETTLAGNTYTLMDVIELIKSHDPVFLANPFIQKFLIKLDVKPQDIDPDLEKRVQEYRKIIEQKNAWF
ncbi:pentatricopeptide repeat-containing protein [Acrasis kona]|uniref:Pentatricopeptide repeat-containing protein n=1 Tax=Acrasis kona TaxID=1008807 RepID=A0AAW2ZGI4_9EUKA